MNGQSLNQNIDLFKWPIFHLFIIYLNFWAKQTMQCKLGQSVYLNDQSPIDFLEQDSNSFLTQVLLTIILNWRPDSTRVISDWLQHTFVYWFCPVSVNIFKLPLLQKVGKKSYFFLPTPRHYLCLHLLWNRSIKCTKYVRSYT